MVTKRVAFLIVSKRVYVANLGGKSGLYKY